MPGSDELFEQVSCHVEIQPTGYRRAGVGTKHGIQAVDVKAYVDILRQVSDDSFADAFPRLPLI